MRLLRASILTAGIVLVASAAPGHADEPDEAPPQDLWHRDTLIGDPGGLRSSLQARGVTLQGQETSAVFGNVSGGIKRGAVYDGVTTLSVKFDTEKLGFWPGGTFYASALQIHGRGASQNLVGNLYNIAAAFEATRATRLYDLFYEQSLEEDRLNVRIGQFRADDEFMLSQYGPKTDDGLPLASATSLFINATFGFPALPAADLPGGGPAYPLPALGVRVKVKPTEALTLLAAIFNGNPAGWGTGNPQLLNHNGLRFPITNGYFAIAEAQYSINQSAEGPGLPGTYRFGAWFNNNSFADQRFDTVGVPLAAPTSNGVPLPHYGNFSLYAGADQMVLQTGATKDHGIGVFGRIMGAPNDRDVLSFYVNAGVTWKGAIPGREQDVLGLGFAYARIGARARRSDTDRAFYDPSGFNPIRNAESVVELTYAAQVAPWWTVQPDLQYIINPGAGIPNQNDPTRTIRNALLLGLVTMITF